LFPAILPTDYPLRPENLSDNTNASVLYARSYLLIRTVVGLLGVALPIFFVIAESAINRSVHFRGSISAYYHSPVRDVFVGGLCTIGFLLIMYMAGQKKRWDWILSTLAGVALIVLVLVPTKRPGLPTGAPLCGTEPQPPTCSWTQQHFGGEMNAYHIHLISAGVFILSLAGICLYWALRDVERRRQEAEHSEKEHPRSGRWELWRAGGARVWVPATCGFIIIVAVAWVPLGVDVWQLTPLYLAEFVSVLAFAAAWLFASRDLWWKLWIREPAGALQRKRQRP